MKLFDEALDCTIVLSLDAPQPVCLAAADLQRDLRQLSGKENGFSITHSAEKGRGIFIRLDSAMSQESYCVRVEENAVEITGADALGAAFGIYAFSHQCLGVLPICRLTDLFPQQRKMLALSPCTIHSKPRKVRFRGWFLNDEDLLTEFRYSGGKRHIDYPYYADVMDTDVLDMVLETALRMELNMIIPASLVDIANPDEEVLVKACYRRGFYITQHHIEPLGLSHFSAENYLKSRGLEESISFLSNRSRMEEMWRFYAEKWAVYGDQVIWQLGLRGRGDRPVWKHDGSVPMDDTARGAILTDAIATQHRIISETLGTKEFLSTATLWSEAAPLYSSGALKLPEDTMVIFGDIGHSQMFGEDFYSVPRKPDTKYGIYYHLAYWGEGPHSAQGVDPRKMAFSYEQAWEKNSMHYAIVNVSNLRPLHFSAWLNAMMMAQPDKISLPQLLEDMHCQIFGEQGKEIKALQEEYFDCLADLGKTELQRRCQILDFYYHEYGKLPYAEFAATDSALRNFGMSYLRGKRMIADSEAAVVVLRQSLEKRQRLDEKLLAFLPTVAPERQLYFKQFFWFENYFMLQLTRWLLGCLTFLKDATTLQGAAAYETAVDALENILKERKVLEQGNWENWHRGDQKNSIPESLALTHSVFQDMTAKS